MNRFDNLSAAQIADLIGSVDAQASKMVVERLQRGEAVAALAREYGTSRQSIMRIRQVQTPSLD